MTQRRTGFYSRTPLWRRIVFSLLIGLAAPPAYLLALAAPDAKGLADLDPTTETLLIFVAVWAAMSAVTCVFTITMFEFWWKRHPPSWMTLLDDDDDETALHEAGYHG